MSTSPASYLEEHIREWREYFLRHQAVQSQDISELEDHLREQISQLEKNGLSKDEAFLVAIKRIGDQDSISREFAREYSERLWKQLVVAPVASADHRLRQEGLIALGLAILAAVLMKLPSWFGFQIDHHADFYARNVTFLVLPVLVGYFVWKRKLSGKFTLWLAVGFGLSAVMMNIYPLHQDAATFGLSAIHIPIALWFLVGVAYAGSRWRTESGRMDFIRYTGELFIYYVLIALGGGVLTAFMVMIFDSIGTDISHIVGLWIVPCGAAGAVIIGTWLVEAKQSVIENMAPVLTRLFTPLFAIVLLVFLLTMLWTGHGIAVARDVLIGFDLLLVAVLGLLVYSMSARSPLAKPGVFDVLQIVLLLSALLANGVALWAIVSRISEFGFTPNRVAALGENIILLVNLAWSSVLYIKFFQKQATFAALEIWQTRYLWVYALWAALVVVAFPPLFGYR